MYKMNGIISGIIGGLIVLVVDKIYLYIENKKNHKNDFGILKKQVLSEINYNISPGVGSRENNFKVMYHEKILHYHNINNNLKNEIEILINAAKQCNAYSGIKTLKIQPGTVKQMSLDLKSKIEKL